MRLFTALLSAALPLAANGQTQLLPAGEFASRDGRPGPDKTWKLSNEDGRAVAQRMNALAAQTPIVIDYEHQTLHAKDNGQPAPAAGWMNGGFVEWLDGKGLFTAVDWTDRARAAINGKEYRFISPVLQYDATGRVLGVVMAALTNFPGLVGMAPAQATALTAALNALNHDELQEPDMALLASLLLALGLPAETTEAAALSAVAALKTKADAPPPKAALSTALTAALGLSEGADETAALSAVATLKGTGTTAATAMAALQGEVAQLRAQVNGAALNGIVDKAIAEGKLAPAIRDWALNLGKTDMAALTAYIAAAPVIPSLAGQTGGKAPDGADGLANDALTGQVMRGFGLTPEQFAKGAPKAA